MTTEDIFGGDGRGRPPIHPFATMAVEDVVRIEENASRIQPYVHVYGRQSGKKFKTRKVEGVLFVKRVS